LNSFHSSLSSEYYGVHYFLRRFEKKKKKTETHNQTPTNFIRLGYVKYFHRCFLEKQINWNTFKQMQNENQLNAIEDVSARQKIIQTLQHWRIMKKQ